MRLYADLPGRRAAQITADVLGVLLVAASVWLGVLVRDLVAALAGIGRQIEEAGAGFSGTMEDIGGTLGGVPLIGDGIRAPFEEAGSAGETLQQVGQGQQQLVQDVATVLGVLVAVVPILVLVAVWLVPRIVTTIRAARVRAVLADPSGLDLLALRALTARSLAPALSVGADSAARWRADDREVVRDLAAAEARRWGVRVEGASRF